MEIQTQFCNRLSELMAVEEVTVFQLAEIIGTGPSTVSRYREGKISIKLSKAIAIADFFHCTLDFLFGRNDNMVDGTLFPALPFYDRLREIMKLKAVSRYRVVKDLNKSNGHFDYWKKGGDPFMQTVIDLADYLDVSIDFLVGRDR